MGLPLEDLSIITLLIEKINGETMFNKYEERIDLLKNRCEELEKRFDFFCANYEKRFKHSEDMIHNLSNQIVELTTLFKFAKWTLVIGVLLVPIFTVIVEQAKDQILYTPKQELLEIPRYEY